MPAFIPERKIYSTVNMGNGNEKYIYFFSLVVLIVTITIAFIIVFFNIVFFFLVFVDLYITLSFNSIRRQIL